MDEQQKLPALCLQVSAAAIICSLIYLMTPEKDTLSLFYPQAFVLYSPLIYGFNCLFLRRSRTLRAVTLWNGAAALALFAGIAVTSESGWEALLFVGFFCIWLTVQGVQSVQQPPKLSQMMIALDISLLMLILLTGYTALTGCSILWSIPIAVGCAAAIVGVVSSRTGGRMGGRGWGFLGTILALLSGLMLLLVRFVAAPAGAGVISVWNALVGAARRIGALLGKALIWLLSLLPVPDGVFSPEPLSPAIPGVESTAEALAVSIPAWMLVAFACLLAAGIYWLARWLGRFSLGGAETARTAQSRGRQRPSLREGLRRLLAAWSAALSRRALLWRRRDYPDGLYDYLLRRSRRFSWRKQPGETPREFLLRLGTGDAMALCPAFSALIPAVDAALFGPPQPDAPPFSAAGEIRRSMKSAALRQGLSNWKARLGAVLSAKRTKEK